MVRRRGGGRLLALLLAAAAAAAAGTRVRAEGGGGFPCAEDEWVAEAWHPPQEATCRSCYECEAGQVCFRRGGCSNCTAGTYDADHNPTHECVPCPAGKTSEDAATVCTEIELSLWEKFTGLDEALQGVIGVSVVTVVGFLLFLACESCCPSARRWLTKRWTQYRNISDGNGAEDIEPGGPSASRQKR